MDIKIQLILNKILGIYLKRKFMKQIPIVLFVILILHNCQQFL